MKKHFAARDSAATREPRAIEIKESYSPNQEAAGKAGRRETIVTLPMPVPVWRKKSEEVEEIEEYTMYVTIITNNQTITGYTNGKNYAGTIYINQLINNEINWKKSVKINVLDITSKIEITNPTAKTIVTTMPKTTVGWMAEMARSER